MSAEEEAGAVSLATSDVPAAISAPAAAATAKSIEALAAASKPIESFFAKKAGPLVPEDVEFTNAKALLSTYSAKSQTSLYNHLTDIVTHVLQTNQTGAVDVLEALSGNIKKAKFRPSATIEDIADESKAVDLATIRTKYLLPKTDENEPQMITDAGEVPDLLSLSSLTEWANVSFGKEETYLLFLSIKKLVDDKPLKSVRLWGKILGTSADYYIVEGELKEASLDEDDVIANGPETPTEEEKPESGENTDAAAEGPTLDSTAPKAKAEPTPVYHKEIRAGLNKYVYYVCHKAGESWIRLPDVTPEQMQASHGFRKYLSGDLTKAISSFPVFNGTEAHLLRCQIARISAATVISPAGYYTFDPEEEVPEDAEHGSSVIINPEFEGFTNEQLLLTTNWVHHVPYILPQGRVSWENPYIKPPSDDDDEDEDDDDEDAFGANLEPEKGPDLLEPISSDTDIGDLPAWSSKLASSFAPAKFSPVILKSTRWPGACTIAYNDKFVNVYVGFGQREEAPYVPKKLGEVQKEFAADAAGDEGQMLINQLVEQMDPTVEQENAYENEKRAAEGGEDEEGAGEEGEEEEDA